MITVDMIQVLSGLIGSVCFAILFNIRGGRLFIAGLGGGISWLLFLLLSRYIQSEAVNYFIVSFAASVYAEIMARLLKTPTTTFVTVSLIPLIPGASLYYTMAHAFQGEFEIFIGKALATLQLAAALALGIIVSTTLSKIINQIFSVLHSKRMKI